MKMISSTSMTSTRGHVDLDIGGGGGDDGGGGEAAPIVTFHFNLELATQGAWKRSEKRWSGPRAVRGVTEGIGDPVGWRNRPIAVATRFERAGRRPRATHYSRRRWR